MTLIKCLVLGSFVTLMLVGCGKGPQRDTPAAPTPTPTSAADMPMEAEILPPKQVAHKQSIQGMRPNCTQVSTGANIPNQNNTNGDNNWDGSTSSISSGTPCNGSVSQTSNGNNSPNQANVYGDNNYNAGK